MTDEEALYYFKNSYFDPEGQGLHQLVYKQTDYWICLNFMLDNHPEWRTCDPKEIMEYVMPKFRGCANPVNIMKWIQHIQDRLGK